MLWAKRQQNGVLGGCRLQLEIELTAESFAERQPPRLVDPAAEGGVQDELHAARFVEEPLEDEGVLCRDDAQRPPSFREVVDQLIDRSGHESCLTRQPPSGISVWRFKPAVDLGTKIADRE